MKRKPLPKRHSVGYKNPPKHTQFKPGASGNPKGRPKGTKNLKTDLYEEINERIQVTEGGQIYSISKQRALLKRLFEKAMKGDVRAAALLLKNIMLLFPDISDPLDGEPFSTDDEAILERYFEEVHQRKDKRRLQSI